VSRLVSARLDSSLQSVSTLPLYASLNSFSARLEETILFEAFVLSSDVSVGRNTNTFSRYFVLSRLSSCASAMISFGAVGAVGVCVPFQSCRNFLLQPSGAVATSQSSPSLVCAPNSSFSLFISLSLYLSQAKSSNRQPKSVPAYILRT
jgi:hypothetical protein